MSIRRPFLAANWKMNTGRADGVLLAQAITERIESVKNVDVAICPPFPYLLSVRDALVGGNISLGAQDVYFEANGAFTGEVSVAMLADCGVVYVLVGHSERRHVIGENDETIQRKVKAVLDGRLCPILCVGELLEEREAGRTHEIVENQLRRGLLGVMPEQLRDVTIAYEPVWAIGTGKVATPDQAEEVHAFVRTTLTKLYGADLAQAIRIQYGGSVKADNAEGLLARPNIDGALVGGASLDANAFAEIVLAGERVALAG